MKTQILIVALLSLSWLVAGCQVCTRDLVYMCNPETLEFTTAPSSCGYNMHAMKSRVLPELMRDVDSLKIQGWVECSEVFTPDQMALFMRHLHNLKEERAEECDSNESILSTEECQSLVFSDPTANPFNYFN
jgi:hypothetical protein